MAVLAAFAFVFAQGLRDMGPTLFSSEKMRFGNRPWGDEHMYLLIAAQAKTVRCAAMPTLMV
jgi:hypothetical protein